MTTATTESDREVRKAARETIRALKRAEKDMEQAEMGLRRMISWVKEIRTIVEANCGDI